MSLTILESAGRLLVQRVKIAGGVLTQAADHFPLKPLLPDSLRS